MHKFFELGGDLPARTKLIAGMLGAVGFLILWELVALSGWISPSILSPPTKVAHALGELFAERHFARDIFYSFRINMAGCAQAAILALPIGFLLGLVPLFKAMSERLLAAVRYLPLPMVIGIFIKAFGIESLMKIEFLACSIFVYLVPAVAQRVTETPRVYVDTARTLGATYWQIVHRVYIPDVMGRVWADIVNLLAISWTYITIVEVINLSDGGVGVVANMAARMGRADVVYAAVIAVMAVGFLIDKAALQLDRLIFRYKYV